MSIKEAAERVVANDDPADDDWEVVSASALAALREALEKEDA